MSTHRFAFTISGGLSMGAYEAGVLSQLYEDLVAVNRADLGCRLVIDAISGASAGSITGLILAQALAMTWTPAQFRERMRQAWVTAPDVIALLQPVAGPEESLFTQDRLGATARATVDDLPPQDTHDPAQAVALWMAITNVDGVPLRIVFREGEQTETTLYGMSYRDYLPYFICGPDIREVSIPTEDLGKPFPASHWWDDCPKATWRAATDGALASASFPVAFRTKPLTRDLTRYGDYKDWKEPGWPETLACQVMDGGIFGNEPIGKAIDAVAYLARLDPARADDDRTYLMIEPGPKTPADLDKAMKAVAARQTPNGLPVVTALVQMVLAYFEDALYSDFINAEKVNARITALDNALKDLALDQAQKDKIRAAAGLGHKKVVALERIPHEVPTRDRLAGDFFGNFGGFLQQDFREMDFCVGQQEARYWLAHWLERNAKTLGADAQALTQALGAEPASYGTDLSDASWWTPMPDGRRNEIVNRGLDRLQQLVFRGLKIGRGWQMAAILLRHLKGRKIHAALVRQRPPGPQSKSGS